MEEALREAIDEEIILGSKKYKKMEGNANTVFQNALKMFFQNYSEQYPRYLNEKQHALIKNIEREIQAQKGLEQSTKDRLKDLQKSDIEKPSNGMKKIDFKNASVKFLYFINYINIDNLIDEAITQFRGELNKLKDQYVKQFADMKSETAKAIKEQYDGRVGEFAGDVRRLEHDRDDFEWELEKLKKLLTDVQSRNKTLTDKINKEVEKEDKA